MQLTDSFRAMDTQVDVIIESGNPRFDLPPSIRLLFESQEERFSRFRPSSLLSALNAGRTVTDARFATAVRMALTACEFTRGSFNPMVLPALLAAGYDRTFREVETGSPRTHRVSDPRSSIRLDGDSVRLTEGALDLGGIVKGWTVDLAVALAGDDIDGVFINAGGDLRAEGSEPDVDGWHAEVERPGGGVAWAGTFRGAIATSTILRRRWSANGGAVAHHLIDPRTGMPAVGPVAQATAWAPETWIAECWAKAVVVGGVAAAERVRAAGVAVLALDSDGEVVFDSITG